MRIVCLAWGSLVWNPGALPVAEAWHTGGPLLPIEFARVGDKGELATVLCPGVSGSSARWSRLGVDDIVTARQLLRQREEIDKDRVGGVGTVVVGHPPAALLGAPEILEWAGNYRDIDAVIWTALPPRFAGTEGQIPTPAEAVEYLRGLSRPVRRHAEDYVRKTAEEIRTPIREALERAIAS